MSKPAKIVLRAAAAIAIAATIYFAAGMFVAPALCRYNDNLYQWQVCAFDMQPIAEAIALALTAGIVLAAALRRRAKRASG